MHRPGGRPPGTGPGARSVLALAPEQRAVIESRARAGYPHEACGVLVGRAGEGRTEVASVQQAANVVGERAHDRYEVDPRDLLRAELSARERGLAVVGVWHSHPDHPARPSETDRRAAWEGWSYVIVSLEEGAVADLRSWRLRHAAFEEETVEEVRP